VPKEEHSPAQPTLLERLDLALATRMAHRAELVDLRRAEAWSEKWMGPPAAAPAHLIAGLLGLRGLAVTEADAAAILAGGTGRHRREDQEYRLTVGLRGALARIVEHTGDGRMPDGWFMVELFRTFAGELPRFRNNTLRRDLPWDTILYVTYPKPGQVRSLLDTFDQAHAFRDFPALFRSLHPVRQSFRILWRLARIAPFPDFNLVMAFVAMNAALHARGYPMLAPRREDRALLNRLVSGPPPRRIARFEARLLELVATTEV